MEIKSYILKNNFLEVKLLNLGACIKKIEIKDKNGILRNLVLSYENIEDYKKNPAYLGAIVGRTAGRIENGLLEIEENSYQLEKNNGNNNLHGGTNSISHKIWEVKNITDSSICFEIFSEHLENSFPANVNIRVQYTLKDNELLIKYFASADRKTYINLTNHSYFNLGNSKTIYEHSLNLNSDYMLELNSEFIPKKIKSLENSIFNFKNKGELRPSDCSPLSWGRSPQSPPKKEVLLKVEYNQNNKKLKEFFEKEKNNEQKKLVGNGIDHPFIIEKNKTFVKL
ncbi:MAG: hypothetical protein KGV57_02105, partial [Fusobacterium sp.]|nr:hypothetical protein [Fusobacterium sp.]